MRFLEGVDAVRSFSNVILTRLPFTVPDEPVVQARLMPRRQDKNPFTLIRFPRRFFALSKASAA